MRVNSSTELGLRKELCDIQLTTQPPVNPHTVTTLPCRHITEKPLTITGCCRYCFSKSRSKPFLKYGVVFDPQCQVYNLSAVASGRWSSVEISPPRLQSDKTKQEDTGTWEESWDILDILKKVLQQLWLISSHHICTSPSRQNIQWKFTGSWWIIYPSPCWMKAPLSLISPAVA